MWSLSYVWKCIFFSSSSFYWKVIYFTNWYQGDLFFCLTSFTILLFLCSFSSLGNQSHNFFFFTSWFLLSYLYFIFCMLLSQFHLAINWEIKKHSFLFLHIFVLLRCTCEALWIVHYILLPSVSFDNLLCYFSLLLLWPFVCALQASS